MSIFGHDFYLQKNTVNSIWFLKAFLKVLSPWEKNLIRMNNLFFPLGRHDIYLCRLKTWISRQHISQARLWPFYCSVISWIWAPGTVLHSPPFPHRALEKTLAVRMFIYLIHFHRNSNRRVLLGTGGEGSRLLTQYENRR